MKSVSGRASAKMNVVNCFEAVGFVKTRACMRAGPATIARGPVDVDAVVAHVLGFF